MQVLLWLKHMEKLASRMRKMQPTTCIFLTIIRHKSEQGVFCVPSCAMGRGLQWCHTQLPIGVAMGSHVKHLFTELCHSSCVLFMARKTENKEAVMLLTSKSLYPQASTLYLRQCSPEERQHSLR